MELNNTVDSKMNPIVLTLAVIWACPGTLLGLMVGVVGLATGGSVQRQGKVLEFWGGAVTAFLRSFPLIAGASAVTFGHTVLGRSLDDLDYSRQHELVHVRQYERWGPLFIPVYLGCSLVQWIRGKDYYRDNPFEREAFRIAP